MGKTSSKYRKKSRYTERSSTSESYYASSNIGYVTKPLPSLSKKTQSYFRDQEKSVNQTVSYDNWLNEYSPNKYSSWCDGNFSVETSTIKFLNASGISAKDDFKVPSQSEKLDVRPRLITSVKEDRGSGNLLVYFLNQTTIYYG